jgi:hypothetical protein
MWKWCATQWQDIKGNVKFWVLTVIAGGMVTIAGIITHGLAWQQQAVLLFIFSGLASWAVAATVTRRKNNPGDVPVSREKEPSSASLSIRTFETCNKLSSFVKAQGVRPSEDSMYENGINGKDFEGRVKKEIAPWDDRIQAGYLLDYRDAVIRLRHELVLALNGKSDDDLDRALSRAESQPNAEFPEQLLTIAEKLRLLASRLPL